jgi:hypothetical protein
MVYQSDSIEAVWRSFQANKDALKSVFQLEKADQATKTKANPLHDNMLIFDFIFTLMSNVDASDNEKDQDFDNRTAERRAQYKCSNTGRRHC